MPAVIESLTDLLNNLPGYYNTAIERINSLPEDLKKYYSINESQQQIQKKNWKDLKIELMRYMQI